MDAEYVRLKKENPEKKVELWAQDEARLGLQPVIRRMWAPKGKRVIANQVRKYQWLYVYAFVHPTSGESFYLLLPSVNTDLMALALREFQKEVDPKDEKIVLLLVDGAGWHRSNELDVPKNIVLFPLPPYSPELQPVECGWPLLRESMANECFESLDALEQTIEKRCRWIIENPDVLKGEIGFEWIRKIEEGTTN